MKKCKGLPLAIVTIGGFLAKQPKTPIEWKKLNGHISAELDINPRLGNIKNILNRSYDGLPYHLKPCFLYLSVFPEDHDIRRARLERRWIAEGYSTEVHGKSSRETAENLFMELIGRSMILPNSRSLFSQRGIDSCQVHDLLREISISRAEEENLVFRLEEGCSSNTNGAVHHLTISSNWKEDQDDFEGTVDVSRIRSLTVFGKWRPFFMSDKMRFLRVLDLEDAWGLCDRHLDHIGKLVHLRYLSLKGCSRFYHLPDSLGNMRQLQTLDIRDTCILVLPKTIIKLKQLQYLCLGTSAFSLCSLLYRSKSMYKALGAFRMTVVIRINGETWRHKCSECWWFTMPIVAQPFLTGIYSLPRGAGNLKALHTLGVVDIRSGKTLKEIKRLTQLRKLVVTGVNKENCEEFLSTQEVLSCLESLAVSSECPGSLHCLSDAKFSPPNNLRSLTLDSNLVEMPAWIKGLQNLVKLRLWLTELTDYDGTMQLLGNLPYLAILLLDYLTFNAEAIRLDFLPEAFPSLMALDLSGIAGSLESVEFKGGAAPNLEVLKFKYSGLRRPMSSGCVSGLASLQNLRKFELSISSTVDNHEAFVEDVRAQLALNQNRPVLIRI